MDKSYLCAPTRSRLSPMGRLLLKNNLINKTESYLDYGCGKGFDYQWFDRNGYNSQGYDPYYFPITPSTSDVVTLNFVLNVIEKECDRITVIKEAWALTNKRLIVSALQGEGEKITQWGTFKKRFTYNELRRLINISTGKLSQSLRNGYFIVGKNYPDVESFNQKEVEKAIAQIEKEGDIAHINTSIQHYYSNGKKYYRLVNNKGMLLNNKKVIHLNKDNIDNAIASIKRRNQMISLKFHCKDYSYLEEFKGIKNIDNLLIPHR